MPGRDISRQAPLFARCLGLRLNPESADRPRKPAQRNDAAAVDASAVHFRCNKWKSPLLSNDASATPRLAACFNSPGRHLFGAGPAQPA
jgi:hypothetical protein